MARWRTDSVLSTGSSRRRPNPPRAASNRRRADGGTPTLAHVPDPAHLNTSAARALLNVRVQLRSSLATRAARRREARVDVGNDLLDREFPVHDALQCRDHDRAGLPALKPLARDRVAQGGHAVGDGARGRRRHGFGHANDTTAHGGRG